MGDFTDNQTVTAADLNQVAIDLGKPTFANFVDNTAYNIDKLNEITSAIVGAGIAIGIGNACKCTMSNGNISIDTGLIFFNSGAKIRLDTAQTIEYTTSAEKQYVYAYNDTALNNISIVIDTEAPTASMDTVMLCTVTDGNLTDSREFSKANVSIPSASQVYQYEKTLYFRASQKMQADIINNNQEYSIAAVYDYVRGCYIAGMLKNNTEVTFSINNYNDVYLTKQGTQIKVSTYFAGRGTNQTSVKIWLI